MKYVVNNDDNFDTSILNWIYERYFFFSNLDTIIRLIYMI